MKQTVIFIFLLILAAAATSWIRYGGGGAYPDLATAPIIAGGALDEVLRYPEPLGKVAVSSDNRLFFTVHPQSGTEGNKLLEWVDGASEPWPDGRSQLQLFDTPLGIVADARDRLWVLDHGNHGLRTPRLLGFDIPTGSLIADVRFTDPVAPAGSMLTDVAASNDGRTLFLSDASHFRKQPALIVYDVRSGSTRRVLNGHESVRSERYVINSNGRRIALMGGLFTLRGGVSGVTVDDEWVYYGAMSGSGLYRVPLSAIRDRETPASGLAALVERYADKPLSGSFSIDPAGYLYVTDIENNAIAIIGPDGTPRTLIQATTLRWPEGIATGPDGWIYVTDSALSELAFRGSTSVSESGPYSLFRFRPNQAAADRQLTQLRIRH
jgi:sugar lactone lactonase YvrE